MAHRKANDRKGKETKASVCFSGPKDRRRRRYPNTVGRSLAAIGLCQLRRDDDSNHTGMQARCSFLMALLVSRLKRLASSNRRSDAVSAYVDTCHCLHTQLNVCCLVAHTYKGNDFVRSLSNTSGTMATPGLAIVQRDICHSCMVTPYAKAKDTNMVAIGDKHTQTMPT